MPFVMLFLFFVVVACVVCVIVFGLQQQKKRRASMRRFAEQRKLRYTEKDRAFARRHEPGFKALRTGGNRYAYNILEGEVERRTLAIFDHHYSVQSGKSTAHYHRTMVLVRLEVDLGVIELRPEHWGDRIAGAFGFDDIDFESAAFSKRYHVKAEQKQLAYKVFHPKMIEYLLSRENIRLATYGRHLLAWRKRSGRLGLPQIRALIENVYDILDRVPRYVRKDRSVD